MSKKYIFIQLILIFLVQIVSGQVKVRIFAGQHVVSGVFTPVAGRYQLGIYDGNYVTLEANEPVILAFFKGKIAVKAKNQQSFLCDSLEMKGMDRESLFTFRTNGNSKLPERYSGDLKCIQDLGFLVFINTCETEQYIAGVVRAEGGPGKNIEYIKSQAILVRTYLNRNFSRHLIDGYNMCDGTHCQAFKGVTTDSLVVKASFETAGLVILDSDSVPIIPAFHSNCGGETSGAESVWLSGHSYIKIVKDPYCVNSHNATWKKSIPKEEWISYLKKSGFVNPGNGFSAFDFQQVSRQPFYKIGSFSIPFTKIRNDLKLKSSFFSVLTEGDSIILRGRGYGHGVGLCQEGAMVMAARGFSYRDIINFYFLNVIITDIKNAKPVKSNIL